MKKLLITILGLLVAGIPAQAEELVIPMHLIDSAGGNPPHNWNPHACA